MSLWYVLHGVPQLLTQLKRKNMNKELLFQLYAIHSPSGNEKKMRKFLRRQARQRGATSIETDAHGNLLIVKGESDTYPCVAAHMDQVQNFHSRDFRVIEIDGAVIGWSPKCHRQQGLGADDKNGIYVCLEMLSRFDCIKVAFFVGEEAGCQGSNKVDLAFFSDCRFIIEPDRMRGTDLITDMAVGSVCSGDFVKAIGYERYGYKPEHGSITDVGTLVERGVGISCLNLSCGYYEPHSDHEMTVLSELENCTEFVAHIIATCTDVYPFEYEDYWGRSYSRYGYGYGSLRSYKSISDEERYYTDGYYEQDEALLDEYLQLQPDLTLDQLKNEYLCEFSAWDFLDKETAQGVIEDLYTAAKDVNYKHGEFWGDDDDDTDDKAGEIVFRLDKVS